MAAFSLACDGYKQNICTGLTSLQQNGEFVDMTLAADGHLVKVHQIMIALASPYLKELIRSAPCPHPVIFLNNVSYSTLCSLLEYIYAGEILVQNNEVNEVLEAARQLRICGLDEMKIELLDDTPMTANKTQGQPLTQTGSKNEYQTQFIKHIDGDNPDDTHDEDPTFDMTTMDHDSDMDFTVTTPTPSWEQNQKQAKNTPVEIDTEKVKNSPQIQYTLSNCGSLQIILNRYIYSHRYTSKKGPNEGYRRWRCVSYKKPISCKAFAVTQGDIVIKRLGMHNHPFHDSRIMKKVYNGNVFETVKQAEIKGADKKSDKTEVGTGTTEVRSDKTEARIVTTGVRSDKIEVRSNKTKVRSDKSEARSVV